MIDFGTDCLDVLRLRQIEGGIKYNKIKVRWPLWGEGGFAALGRLMTRSSPQSAGVTVACSTIYTVSDSMFSPSTLAFSAYKRQEEEEEDARRSQHLLLHRSRYLCRWITKRSILELRTGLQNLFNYSRCCIFLSRLFVLMVEFWTAFQLGEAALTLGLHSSDELSWFEAALIDGHKWLLLNSDESWTTSYFCLVRNLRSTIESQNQILKTIEKIDQFCPIFKAQANKFFFYRIASFRSFFTDVDRFNEKENQNKNCHTRFSGMSGRKRESNFQFSHPVLW